jgi:trigger factor
MSSPTNTLTNPSVRKPLEIPLYVPPARRAEQGQPVELPQVAAPSLEGLSVTVPAPEGFTAEQVQERFQELARAHATERYRLPTEALAWGDEVLLNIVGYANGRLIPFSVRTHAWLTLEPEPMLPGFYETLCGHSPGESLVVDVVLPDEYPVEALRGCPARFLVDIQAARQVVFPDPESPEFLEAFGRGGTLEEATRLVTQLMEEEATQMLLVQAQQLVLNEVASRTQVELPARLIDEEIRRRWGASEGRALLELHFSDEEQEESLSGWLADPATREEAEQRLRIALALGAICRRDGLTLSPERVEKLLREEAAAAGVSMDEVADALRAEPHRLAQIDQVAWHLLAVDHVMSRATVHFATA